MATTRDPAPKISIMDSRTNKSFLQNAEEAAEIKKKRTFRKFSYRGIDLDAYVTRSD
jgi:hypothetical protein